MSKSAEKAVDHMRKGWGIVEKNQERISALVMDMLTFSKEREPVPEPSNLNELVCDVVELMKARASDEQVELVWLPGADDAHADVRPRSDAPGDPQHHHQRDRRLPRSRGGPGGSVARSTATPRKWPAWRSWITAAASNRMTWKRSLACSFRARAAAAPGLGLPVSQKILEEHGGRIRVESKLGEGSRFTLEFPAITPQPATSNTMPAVRGSTNIEAVPADSSHG